MIRINLILVLLLLAACSCQPHAQRTAQKYVNGWSAMGMYLPTDQVAFFGDHFEQVAGILADSLRHPKEDVRQRAAYVIAGLREQARPLEPAVVRAIGSETNRLVRLYLYDSIGAMGATNPSSVAMLKARFAALPKEELEPAQKDIYTSVDERMYLASALYLLDPDRRAREEHLSEVTLWLQPPRKDMNDSALGAYWDHRWCAVNAVEHMRGATQAVSLLEGMLSEKATKPWVSVHVPRVIIALQKKKL